MNSTNDFNNSVEIPDGSDSGGSLSVEDFIKELEAKEKDLHISSDLTIEIDDGDIVDGIPDFLRKDFSVPAPNPANYAMSVEPPADQRQISRLEQELSQLQVQVSRKESERIELAEALRRRQVDFDNYRKRIERDRSEAFLGQIGNLAKQMLPVLDNLDRAMDFAANHAAAKSPDFQQFYEGIVMVNQQLNEVMASMGVHPIASVGEHFDPYYHEAVAAEESRDFPPNTITGELLRGYRLGDRVVRPAMVKVAMQGRMPQSGSPAAASAETSRTGPADQE